MLSTIKTIYNENKIAYNLAFLLGLAVAYIQIQNKELADARKTEDENTDEICALLDALHDSETEIHDLKK